MNYELNKELLNLLHNTSHNILRIHFKLEHSVKIEYSMREEDAEYIKEELRLIKNQLDAFYTYVKEINK